MVDKLIKGTSKNAFFPRLLRQRRTRILIYAMYTAVLRAALPCTHAKNAVFRGALKGIAAYMATNIEVKQSERSSGHFCSALDQSPGDRSRPRLQQACSAAVEASRGRASSPRRVNNCHSDSAPLYCLKMTSWIDIIKTATMISAMPRAFLSYWKCLVVISFDYSTIKMQTLTEKATT